MLIRGLRDIIVYVISSVLSFFIYIFLDLCGALEVFSNDLIPLLNIWQFLLILGMIISLFCIWSAFKHKMSSLHMWIIKYKDIICISMFVLSIIVWKKAANDYKLLLVVFSELMLLYLFLEYESTKLYAYRYELKDEVVSNYAEKPVVGRNVLTKSQKKALDQLIYLLDERKGSDSFNIALIGAWGSGKTSITDTLIYELQLRNKDDNRYFVLKISTQTFNSTKNIVEYVNKYLYTLFKMYGIGGIEKQSNMVFLSALSKMLGDTSTTAAFSGMIDRKSESLFSDVENERTMFSERIQLLLKRSGRKNIVFVVDDADRTDIEKEVLNLLTEFSSINGLITIVLLDKKYDVILRPEEAEDVVGRNQIDEYNAIDKYVHIRVRIEENYHIEYEKSIKSQILLENNHIEKKKNCYIACPEKNERISIFAPIRDYQTSIKIAKNHLLSDYSMNLLTDIFLINLEKQEEGFGKYLENVVMDYIYNSKELWPHVVKLLTIKPEQWNMELWQFNANWTGGGIPDERFDWVTRIRNNSNQYFFMLLNLIEAISLVNKIGMEDKKDILSIEDLYDYFMINKFPISDRTWENRNERPVIYSGMNELKYLVFSDEEINEIQGMIEKQDYRKLPSILADKIKSVGNLFVEVALLVDFIEYMRKIMNNYRTFKMQLREAALLNINYLDYLIKEWQPTSNVVKQIEELKKENPVIKDINIPPLSSFINTIFYSLYITQYGKRFLNNELKGRRLWIYREHDDAYLVLSQSKEGVYNNIVLDYAGKNIVSLSNDLQSRILNKTSEIFE